MREVGRCSGCVDGKGMGEPFEWSILILGHTD